MRGTEKLHWRYQIVQNRILNCIWHDTHDNKTKSKYRSLIISFFYQTIVKGQDLKE